VALAEHPLPVVSRRDLVLLPAHDAEHTVVRLRGEHDMFTAAALSDILDRAIALDRDVMVDLSGVEFMAAATVGVILGARESLRLRSRSLALRSPSRCARRVLELCGLEDLIGPPGAEVAWATGTADGPSS
jgi:anti-anti-sigma factor